MSLPFTIRALTREETAIAVQWAAAEGWRPGTGDMECFLGVDPEGFLGGFLGEELVATISAVRYPGGFGFVGFYIVKPGFRGQGLGIRLWRAGMARLEGYNVGLDGVLAQEANYAKSGFRRSHGNRRYETTPLPAGDTEPGLADAREIDFSQLAAYDRAHFPDERRAFLQRWISLPQRTPLVCLEGGAVRGFGVLRAGDGCWRIGPLFADTPEHAARLLRALRQTAPEGPVYLDVPTNNPAAITLAEGEGMSVVFETTRMYTGENPRLADSGVYGITTMELG
jgi:hypothetical protein